MRRHNRETGKRSSGFTLLEAIVAMVIFAAGATALYGWVNANLITLNRVDSIHKRAAATESAIEFLSTLDPISQPNGDARVGSLEIRWTSTATEYKSDVLDEQGQKSINEAQLYRVHAVISRDGEIINEVNVNLLGLRKVRDSSDVIF